MTSVIPLVLFAYARPDYLKRTLESLKENRVPLIYAFSDAPKTPDIESRVQEVRKILHGIDWCEIHIVEREENLGLGKSILAGVSEVLKEHDSTLVFEDDLICVPGTYDYLCAALHHYQNDSNVMSVTGWTHPRVTPTSVKDQPYFDGRTDCLVWGTWKRAWEGMEQDSLTMIEGCKQKGIDVYRYGADLVEMANGEKIRNIWAVRFSYLHILNQGVCLRPPYSLVQHIGYDPDSVNVKIFQDYIWHVELPERCPPIPHKWPDPVENLECPALWQKACGTRPGAPESFPSNLIGRSLEIIKRLIAKTRKYGQPL
jgi:hypothetical protein